MEISNGVNLFFYTTIFLFGLSVGSFLNCVIYRLETGGSFLRGRSFCPRCKHTLSWQDLIPVFSFFCLRGRCRYCQEKISWQYPLVELATGFLFVLFFEIRSPIIDIWEIGSLAIIPFLVIIFVYDLKHYIIPDKVIYPAIGIALVYDLWKSDFLLSIFGKSDFLLSAFGATGFFLAIVVVSRGKWMGTGDIKLGFLMGLLLGWPKILVALFLAFLTGAIIGIGLMALGKKTLKSEVPFGPFLVTGTFAVIFWGQQIIDWYLSLCTKDLLY